jgi:hypothetical protein
MLSPCYIKAEHTTAVWVLLNAQGKQLSLKQSAAVNAASTAVLDLTALRHECAANVFGCCKKASTDCWQKLEAL